MKKLTLIISICITLYSCSIKPVYVEYFKPGDMLLPDYAILDTLIVLDATDQEIANVFYQYCKIKN